MHAQLKATATIHPICKRTAQSECRKNLRGKAVTVRFSGHRTLFLDTETGFPYSEHIVREHAKASNRRENTEDT